MKKLIIFFLLLSNFCHGQFTGGHMGAIHSAPTSAGTITYLGSASVPVDNSANNATQGATITPPSGMAVGDLVVVYLHVSSTGASFTHSNTGGQTWNVRSTITAQGYFHKIYWCEYNGTWSANPSWTIGNVNTSHSVTGVMHVFHPSLASKTWSVNAADAGYGTSSSSTTPSYSGLTTTQPNALAIVNFNSSFTAATFTSPTNSWVFLGSNQYRNTTTNHSVSYVYKLIPTAGATGSVGLTAGSANFYNHSGISFYEL